MLHEPIPLVQAWYHSQQQSYAKLANLAKFACSTTRAPACIPLDLSCDVKPSDAVTYDVNLTNVKMAPQVFPLLMSATANRVCLPAGCTQCASVPVPASRETVDAGG